MAYRKPKKPQRIYVKVSTAFDLSGYMQPISITWSDGRIFPIEEVTNFQPASALEPGRTGDCYTVIIKGERKHLFFKRNLSVYDHRFGRWWVEVISL